MKKNLIYYMFGILFLLGACYDDKGNYNYSEINEIVVDLAESYVLPLTDTTLVIRPNISQTLLDRKDNLTYTWQCSNSTFASAGNADTISYADTVAIVINPDSSEINYNYYLRFNIYDHEYGIMHPYQTRIQVFKPYQGAWMVLHKQEGETRLGSVEYLGEERASNNDVYYPATGKKLQGEPVNIACHDFAIASEYFEKGKRQNSLLPEHIDKIVDAYQYRKEDDKKFSRRVSVKEIEENGYNLNISRYVSTAPEEEIIDIQEVWQELEKIDKDINKAKTKHNEFLKELGLKQLP